MENIKNIIENRWYYRLWVSCGKLFKIDENPCK